jgi:hypothetical protein
VSPRIPENQIVTKQCKHSVYCKVSLKCTPPNILQFDFLLFVFVKLGCHTDVAKPDNAPCSQRKQCSLVSPDSLFWDATLCLVTTRHHLVLGRDTTVLCFAVASPHPWMRPVSPFPSHSPRRWILCLGRRSCVHSMLSSLASPWDAI